MKLINWIKDNKLSSFLLLILTIILSASFSNKLSPPAPIPVYDNLSMEKSAGLGAGVSNLTANSPSTLNQTRLVSQNSYLSLLVKDVRSSSDNILEYTKNNNGFMVNSSLNNPEDVASATISVRIPSRKLKPALDYFRSLSVKVISENLTGEDITDQYTDINSRLQTLNSTKAKFEEILAKSTEISDILNVQREIINLQSQIDSLIGQQKYLEKSAELSLITMYLSTDELSLPYAPTALWRPEVIFKTAVRSLIQNLRNIGTLIIWVLVYSIIWLPIIAVIIFIRKKNRRKNQTL